MKNSIGFFILTTACFFCLGNSQAKEFRFNFPDTLPVLAFPGAEGFGQYTSGGRGGKVIYVTNLNDAGPGSLREAVSSDGPRYVLFALSGTIALDSAIIIRNGDLTIAGQSAPGDGICIKNYPVYFDADNIVIRFMRFRLGDERGSEDDAFGGRFHKNIMIDHCSMSWSVDECVSMYQNEHTTLQWCLIAESLSHSAHHKGSHGFGGIWGGRKTSFHHNLLAHHSSRNPRLGERAGEAFALTDLVDLRNNVIYNWGYNSCYGGEAMNANIVNCYYKPGPATIHPDRIFAPDKYLRRPGPIYDRWGSFYVEGNYLEGSPESTANNWELGVVAHIQDKYDIQKKELIRLKRDKPHPIRNNVYTDPPHVAYEKVLAWSGASLNRDSVDQRIISNVKSADFSYEGSKGSTNGMIDSQEDVGGYPVLQSLPAPKDSSNDGLPDVWKQLKGLSIGSVDTNGHDLDDEYENIEVYLNELAAPVVFLPQKD